MAKVLPYTVENARLLVEDAIRRQSNTQHAWRQLNRVYATGDMTPLADSKEASIMAQVYGVYALDKINLALPNINIVIASVSDELPQWVVRNQFADGIDDDGEEILAGRGELLLDYFWTEMKGTRTYKKCIKDMVILGSGFAKVGWTWSEGVVTKPILDQVIDEVDGKAPTSTMDLTIKSQPFFEYVSPFNLFVPAEATELDNARWVCERVRKPVDELRAQLDLPGSVEVFIDPIKGFERFNNDAGSDFGKYGPLAIATVYEFYDQRAGQMMIFQEKGDKALFSGPIPYWGQEAPYVHMRNYQVDAEDFYGFGDMLNVASLQVTHNRVFSNQVSNVLNNGSFVFMDARLITEDVQEALETPEDGKVIPIKREILGNVPMSDAILPFESNPVSADLYRLSAELQDAPARVIGLNDFQRGLPGASRMPGTAAAAMEGHTSLRSSGKQGEIARFLSEVGGRILMLSAQWMTDELAFAVLGPNGPTVKQVTAKHLAGKLLVKVDSGSISAVNPVSRRHAAQEDLQTIGGFLSGSDEYDKEPFIRSFIRETGKNPDHLLVRKAQPAPAEQAPLGPDAGAMPPAMQGMPSQAVPDASGAVEPTEAEMIAMIQAAQQRGDVAL